MGRCQEQLTSCLLSGTRNIFYKSIASYLVLIGQKKHHQQRRAFGKGYEGRVDRVGEFKSPIVKALWERRLEEKEMEEGAIANPIPRKSSESKTVVTYDFSNDLFLRQVQSALMLTQDKK